MRASHRQAGTEIPIVAARSDSERRQPAPFPSRAPGYDRFVERFAHPHSNLGDILANAITHGIGAALAIAGAVYLIVASTRGSARLIVCCSIFSGSLVLVYLCSTLYHSLVRTRARHVFHVLDHSSIYLLIAGTYTPFTLVSLRGTMGWTVFGVEWALALAGVVAKSVAMEHFTRGRLAVISTVIYLFRAGSSSLSARPLVHAIGWHGMPGWAPVAWPTRWASSSSPSTAAATSTPPGTSSCSPAASPTTSRFCSMLCRRHTLAVRHRSLRPLSPCSPSSPLLPVGHAAAS